MGLVGLDVAAQVSVIGGELPSHHPLEDRLNEARRPVQVVFGREADHPPVNLRLERPRSALKFYHQDAHIIAVLERGRLFPSSSRRAARGAPA
jgi:hypothetical protein